MSKSKVNKYSDIVTTLIKTTFSMKETIILIFIRILVNCKKKYHTQTANRRKQYAVIKKETKCQ